MSENVMPRVVLVGPPGSGKSTTARVLAQQLKVLVRDTDYDVEVAAGKPIAEIFIDDGEPKFRAQEVAAVTRALAEHSGVLALGGGAVLAPQSQAHLDHYREKGGLVVFLDVSLTQAAPRVGFNQSRPLLLGNPRGQWKILMEQRRPTYEAVSNATVMTDNKSPQKVALEILQLLEAK